MSKIYVSGLVNTETTARVRRFPIDYYPIDYPFFGVQTAVSGVAYNIALALHTLGDRVQLATMTGRDFQAAYIRSELEAKGIGTEHIKQNLKETPSSVVLYDETGRRQIYCDLKDIQETAYGFSEENLQDADIIVACNINFNRDLLRLAKKMGKTIATDVHVLGSIDDDYNREFLECADILFLSDEAVGERYQEFMMELARRFDPKIIVMGRGAQGAAMYLRSENQIIEMPAAQVGKVANTVGAGDALFSAFLHYDTKGFAPADCLARAQVFAAAKIGTSGASKGFVTEQRIEELLWN